MGLLNVSLGNNNVLGLVLLNSARSLHEMGRCLGLLIDASHTRLDGRASGEGVHPSGEMGICLNGDLEMVIEGDPGIEGDICNGIGSGYIVPVAQLPIENAEQAQGFGFVAGDAVGYGFRGTVAKMPQLAEHGPNAAHLKHQPLQCIHALSAIARPQHPGFFCQIDQNRPGFKNRQPRIPVGDHRDFAVGVEGDKFGAELFFLGQVNGVDSVGESHFFEGDRRFATVGRGSGIKVNHE